jgi:hypothetical protein
MEIVIEHTQLKDNGWGQKVFPKSVIALVIASNKNNRNLITSSRIELKRCVSGGAVLLLICLCDLDVDSILLLIAAKK